MDTDVRVLEVEAFFRTETARTPLKFGGVVMDASCYCHVRATVENRAGQRGQGWGAIFMSDVWAWPTPAVEHAVREALMCEVVRRWCRRVSEFKEYAHPIEMHWQLEEELEPIAAAVCRERQTAEAMPRLCALVCASPVDGAVHDAWGNAAGIDCYSGYGRDHMRSDLSTWLGPDFAGRYVADYLVPMPAAIDTFHLVGGLDKLT